MNIALVLAGGVGLRTGLDMPKQFHIVKNKPIVIHTLEAFQSHPSIDKIAVVCLSSYENMLTDYAKRFGITKLDLVVNGGSTSQESIKNGVEAIAELSDDDDIVIIHDGVRPMLNASVISGVIAKCRQYGAAAAAMPYNEQVFVSYDGISSADYIPRDNIIRVQTPQAYKFRPLYEAYSAAYTENIGIEASSYTNTMWVDLGNTLWFSPGSERNFKITTSEDIQLFEALYEFS